MISAFDFGQVMTRLHTRSIGSAALLFVSLTAGCNGSAPPAGAPAGGGRGAMPPMPVEAITLVEQPIEQSTEFVGMIKSRNSTTVQPQVEGFLTRIAVKSGDRVARGGVLFEIDSASLQVAVSGLESVLAAREADAAFARQQAQRMKSLFDVGAASQQELEQAQTLQKTAEAQLKVVQEQIRQQRTDLAYYRVTAPTAGVIGDIPVHQGERVTRATVLTTIDDNATLEAYINVPVQQAPNLKTGLPVRLTNDAGEVLTTEKITFVAPSVDDTQTVLAKAAISRGGLFRPDQFVRAKIVWSTKPGLTIPVVATLRINGQYFVFVAETTAQGTVARQRQVVLGSVVGNDYIVQSGVKTGEQLITAGIQKIGDGAPVQVSPAGRGAAPAAGGGK